MANITIRDDEHWMELREQNVGASEVGCLFPGVDPFKTRFELHCVKAKLIPAPDLRKNKAVRFGQVFEAGTAKMVAEDTGWTIRKVRRYITSPTVEGQAATLDYETHGHPRGAAPVQIKVVGRKWEEIPLVYQLQVQQEMAVTGRDWGALGVAFLDRREVAVFEFDRHDAVIAKLEAEVVDFWRAVHEGREPEPNFERDLEAIRKRYRTTHKGEQWEPMNEEAETALGELARQYHEAQAAESAGKKAKRTAQAEILNTLKDAGFARVGEFRVSTWDVADTDIEAHTRKGGRRMKVSKPKAQQKKEDPR